MDNDLFRRGKPTVWSHFSESLALLVGDALQTLAFELLSGAGHIAVIQELSRALGDLGVVRGQVRDTFLRQDALSLDELLIQDKASTFIVRVQGHSMIKDNIHPGDILIVDRAKRARPKSVVIAVLDGELTVKRLMKDDDGYYLKPANQAFPVIRLREGSDFQVWGVVTFSIHKHEE